MDSLRDWFQILIRTVTHDFTGTLQLLFSSHALYISLQEHFKRTLTVAFKRYDYGVESTGGIQVCRGHGAT
jgi:hypothetical protein